MELKTGARLGDNADMCMIELVDYNENMLGGKAPVKAKTARRGKKKSTSATATDVESTDIATDDSAKSE